MNCKCIVQSGPNKGKQCGRGVKEGTTCGMHRKTCVRERGVSPPAAARRAAPAQRLRRNSPAAAPKLRRDILLFINQVILDESIDELTLGQVKDRVRRRFGLGRIKEYFPYMREIASKKAAILKSPSCSRCVSGLESLRLVGK